MKEHMKRATSEESLCQQNVQWRPSGQLYGNPEAKHTLLRFHVLANSGHEKSCFISVDIVSFISETAVKYCFGNLTLCFRADRQPCIV